MIDALQALIELHRARMAMLGDTLERQGYLMAVSDRDPSYSILLSRSSSPDSVWRVTSFRDRQPVGHREYDALSGAGPTRDALAEFSSPDMVLSPMRSPVRPATLTVPTMKTVPEQP